MSASGDLRGTTESARIVWRTSSSSTAVGYGSRPVTAKWQQSTSDADRTEHEQRHDQSASSASTSAYSARSDERSREPCQPFRGGTRCARGPRAFICLFA